eukprot:3141874-Amphidinium_carterae.1
MTWASALPQWRGNLTRIAVAYSRNYLRWLRYGLTSSMRPRRAFPGASGAEGQKTMLAASLV